MRAPIAAREAIAISACFKVVELRVLTRSTETVSDTANRNPAGRCSLAISRRDHRMPTMSCRAPADKHRPTGTRRPAHIRSRPAQRGNLASLRVRVGACPSSSQRPLGSKPEVTIDVGHVRSNPKSRRQTRQPACLLRANRRLPHRNKRLPIRSVHRRW